MIIIYRVSILTSAMHMTNVYTDINEFLSFYTLTQYKRAILNERIDINAIRISDLSLEGGLLYVYTYGLLRTIVYYYIVLHEDLILDESLVPDSSYTIVIA